MKPSPVALLLLMTAGCAATPPLPRGPIAARELAGTDGTTHAVPATSEDARLTVLVFFSAHCPCQSAHDERLREIDTTYRGRGVELLGVDSEAGASLARDAREAEQRRYAFPILIDSDASLARALGADYATYAVVIDRGGTVRYRGGIDSDRTHLTAEARPYLRDAIDDLLGGHPPRAPTSKALGCALQTR